jgi:hypothetical protein
VKVTGFVAKLMEMMFPSQERNWELKTSAVPSIPKKDLDVIIKSLEAREELKARDEGREPLPITSDDIEREVKTYANARKDEMESEIADQLDDEDTDYPNLCKRVLRSGGIYGFGVARSPNVRTLKERVWVLNKVTGKYEGKIKKLRRPYPEYVRIWDIYPDFSAHTWRDQDRIFERMVLGRRDLRMLSKRPDFIADNIRQYLQDHQQGNFKEREFEVELREASKSSDMTSKDVRRYEIFRHLGYVTAHDLANAGVDVGEQDMDEDILADIWIIDNTVIKAEVAAFGERPSDQYPVFIATEDDDSGLTGVGLPEQFRDSQMAICASTRAMLDNMAVIAGPIFDVNEELMSPSQRQALGPIHAFMTIRRGGDGPAAQHPAVRAINVQSHINEIQSIIKMQREQLDMESNLPSLLFGSPQEPLGEAFRTTSNMSMMVGGANMVSKDTVRAFDKFTTMLIGGFLKWNMEFNEREDIKGDFGVRAKGNFSLVAKEIRGAALDQFMSTLTDQDRAMFDIYGIQLDRLKARDLPTDRLFTREEAEQRAAALRQPEATAAQVEMAGTQAKTEKDLAEAEKKRSEAAQISETTTAMIQEILSRVQANASKAKNDAERNTLENLRLLLEGATQTPQE